MKLTIKTTICSIQGNINVNGGKITFLILRLVFGIRMLEVNCFRPLRIASCIVHINLFDPLIQAYFIINFRRFKH